ncbi:hypothetical protein C8J56DRAFT_884843 [Mycena floridula]|nr:hypothetical protein C8J56DRAFT_884843 [Mycena floridula]
MKHDDPFPMQDSNSTTKPAHRLRGKLVRLDASMTWEMKPGIPQSTDVSEPDPGFCWRENTPEQGSEWAYLAELRPDWRLGEYGDWMVAIHEICGEHASSGRWNEERSNSNTFIGSIYSMLVWNFLNYSLERSLKLLKACLKVSELSTVQPKITKQAYGPVDFLRGLNPLNTELSPLALDTFTVGASKTALMHRLAAVGVAETVKWFCFGVGGGKGHLVLVLT